MDERTELGLPAKIALFHRGSHIEIVRKWFGSTTVFLTFNTVWWSAIFWGTTYPQGFPAAGNDLLLFQGAIVSGFAYPALAGWVNRTHITVGQGKLQVRHAPIPWPGNRIEDSSNLKQIFAKEVHRHKMGITYQLHAITKNDRTIKLVRGLESSEQAHYIEQQIEKYLNIGDAPVKGEIGH